MVHHLFDTRGRSRAILALAVSCLVCVLSLASAAAAGADSFSWSGPFVVDSGQATVGVSCPAANQCTAVDTSGNEVTFDPITRTVNSAGVKPLAGYFFFSAACPSTTQCTAVGYGGNEVTFDPTTGTPNSAGSKRVGTAGNLLYSVACPSTTQCTAVDNGGNEVTFDPTTGTPNSAGTRQVDPTGSIILYAVACPSTTQCTAGDSKGNEVTFDPATGTPNSAGVTQVDSTANQLFSVACPLSTQCTAVDNFGNEVTFDPTTGIPTGSGRTAVDTPGTSLDSVACPSTIQCTAVDTGGNEVTFDPTSPSGATPKNIDGTHSLNSVACPSTGECVAVDDSGRAFAGFVAPSNTSPPTISGLAQQGQTLSEHHGAWKNNPTAFSYQWLRCDSAGNNCTAITGATGQTYTLTLPDVGHTIRVQETATNPAGSSTATSAQSAAIAPNISASTQPAKPLATTTATLNGTVNTGGSAVTWQFQFGQNQTYNKATPIQTIPAGKTAPVAVAWKLIKLQPNTLYHFRLVAITQAGSGQNPITTYGTDLTFKTKPTGKLKANFSTLKVAGGFVFVPLGCQSKLACNGRFSITTTAKLAKKKTASILCDTTFFKLKPGKSKKIKAKIYPACLTLLHHAKHHHTKAQFTSRPRTGQLGTIKNITLML